MSAHALKDDSIARVRSFVVDARGWKRAGIAFAAGSASVLAFAPVFAWPVLFLTFPVFIWLIDTSEGWRAAARAGWWFGFGYFFFSLFWIGEAFLVEAEKFALLLPVAITLLPAGLAFFFSAVSALSRLYWPNGFSRVLVFATVFAILEWLRGHALTGLPWNLLGYALTASLPLMQGAAVVGAYGLTALAAVIFSAPLAMLGDAPMRAVPRRTSIACAIAVALVPLGALYAFGVWRLTEPAATVPGIKLRLVQPSVPQREKWMPEHQRRIFEDHLRLSLTSESGAIDNLAGITHVVWPEAAMPFLPLEHQEALDAIANILPPGVNLVTGALRRELAAHAGTQEARSEDRLFNGILVFDTDGKLVATYDKIHLVPFGEYLPLEPVLSAIGLKKLTHGRGAFTPGPAPRPLLAVPALPPTLGLVCYEALFPGAIVQGPQRPDVLINVTNDGWFGNTSGPRQHFQQSRVRAVEEGIPLIRVANNGISGVIDAFGRIGEVLDLNVRGVIDSTLPAAIEITPYAKYGDATLVIILVLYAASITTMQRKRR